jgi:hypothetical protein
MQTPIPRLHLELPLMAIPARVESDDEAVLAAARAGYAAWSGERPEAGIAPLRLRLERVEGPGGEAPPEIRVEGPVLRLEGPGVEGEADARRRVARCTVSAARIAEPERLLAEVLDPLLLFLLTRAGRVPVHAAGVMIGETAAVLAGPSGAGKSTLTLCALRQGLEVLSDDTLFVNPGPPLRLWGLPRPVHLLPGTPLRPTEGAVLRRRGGRWKLALPASQGWAGGAVAARAALCLLERGDRVALQPLAPEAAVAEMERGLEPGFDHFRALLPRTVRALAAGGAWRLTLSARPEEALEALKDAIGR